MFTFMDYLNVREGEAAGDSSGPELSVDWLDPAFTTHRSTNLSFNLRNYEVTAKR